MSEEEQNDNEINELVFLSNFNFILYKKISKNLYLIKTIIK